MARIAPRFDSPESETDGGRTETTSSPLNAPVGCALDVVNARLSARDQAADHALVRCGQNARHGHFPPAMRPGLLSVALTRPALGASGPALTNSLEWEKPITCAWRACSPGHVQQRQGSDGARFLGRGKWSGSST